MRPSEIAERAKRSIDPPWDDLRAARIQRRVLDGYRRRGDAPVRARTKTRGQVWLGAAVAALLAVVGIVVLLVRDPRSQAPAPTVMETPPRLELPDGSVVTVAAAADGHAPGRVVPTHVSSDRIEVRQIEGAASYEVAKKPDRAFVVVVDDVRVEVVGTSFRVEKLDGAVRVVVTEGTVHVTQRDRSVVLRGGDEITLADTPSVATTAAATATATATAPATAMATTEPTAEASDDLPSASAAQSSSASPGRAAQLFRQADDARAAGDVAGALRLLRQLVAEHPRDSRAGLAWFTIGRLELQRGNAAAAADAFEACGNAMGGQGLAEAALARSSAGQTAKARALARRYLDLYPQGDRVAEMEKLAP